MLPDRDFFALEDLSVWEPTLTLLSCCLLSSSSWFSARKLTFVRLAWLASSFPSVLETSRATSLLIKL